MAEKILNSNFVSAQRANLTAAPAPKQARSFVFPSVAITNTFQFFSETVIVFITLVIYSCLMYFSYTKWKNYSFT